MTKDCGVPIIALGASGGQGLTDLCTFLRLLPAGFPAAIAVTLHRRFDVPSALREILQRSSRLPVRLIVKPCAVEPGVCFLGDPSRHLAMNENGLFDLIDDPHRKYRNATVDLLFRTLADHAASRTTAVVLSGCLSDGSNGLLAVKSAGGRIMAREPWPSIFSDMPRNAIKLAGPLDYVGSIERLASRVLPSAPASNSGIVDDGYTVSGGLD